MKGGITSNTPSCISNILTTDQFTTGIVYHSHNSDSQHINPHNTENNINHVVNPTLEGADPVNLNTLNLNCRSIRRQQKRGLLQSIITEHNANIILGCESHLDDSYSTSEIFPTNFTVFRRDRTNGGGGVFIAFKDDLPLVEQPLSNEAEMMWTKL